MDTVLVRQTRADDISALIDLQKKVYPTISPWRPTRFRDQLAIFPEGQLVAEYQGNIIGCASSLIVAWDDWAESHTWKEITSSGTFDNHTFSGRTLYGAEIFVAPERRGLGVGHLLYEGRKSLCRHMNLKRIIACGRLPGYQRYAGEMTAEFYAQKVVWGDIRDPVLSFQLGEGFHYCGVIANYLPEDIESAGYASIIVWLNPHYRPDLPTSIYGGEHNDR